MKYHLLNFAYYALIIVAAFGIASLSLTRKINEYRAAPQGMMFIVNKDEVAVTTPTDGIITRLHVSEGDHVETGETLADISVDSNNPTAPIQRYSNITRVTEEVITGTVQYRIMSPRSGYIKSISATEGGYSTGNSTIMMLYADDNTKLETSLGLHQIQDFQRYESIRLYSGRLDQTFNVTFSTVREADQEAEQQNQYIAIFELDSINGAALLNGEGLVLNTKDLETPEGPADQVANLWNRMILAE